MTEKYAIRNVSIISDGKVVVGDVFLSDGIIERIGNIGSTTNAIEIEGQGKLLIPGAIDDQVHFREPGLTHKAEIATESLAALAGGVTSFMEMPNVIPPTINNDRLEEKMAIAAANSHVNYSFFLGATNHNLEDLKRINPSNTAGVKIFMGSSTGDMLVDDYSQLNSIFRDIPTLIATHCENEDRIKTRTAEAIAKYGEDIPMDMHAWIRDEEACRLSSACAMDLATKHNSRLHILHISTAIETTMFSNQLDLSQKLITSEVCVHHLHFTGNDYAVLGSLIKCNPAIKTGTNRDALWEALLDDRLDIIATDHAPHTLDEKQQKYLKAPSGLPLVQHSILLMLEYAKQGKISYEKVIEKMCHAPAICFNIPNRGFIREGYMADLVLVNPKATTEVSKENLFYKCGWSPLENTRFNHCIEKVFVNGTLSWDNGYTGKRNVQRLKFDR